MTDVISQWAKTTLPNGEASPYRSSSLSLGRGSQAELKVKLDISADNLADGDLWKFVRLPADAVITNAFLTVGDLDDGTDLTVSIKCTDGTTPDVLLPANAVAQAGGTVFASEGVPYIGADGPIEVFCEVEVSAGTPKAGEATLTVHFSRA